METAFDGFWEKHQLKMEQYVQLWKFEQHFQEVGGGVAATSAISLVELTALGCSDDFSRELEDGYGGEARP